MKDSELLQAWVTRSDETAFAELVRRHIGLVHASARRQVGASPLADDVTQAVFLVLARKAGSLGSQVMLSGWLFRTTRFVAARALRAEHRRSHHESLAAMQPLVIDAPSVPDHWKEVEPQLDAALAALPAADRDALLLRYFEGKPLRAVGQALGIHEEAAKKRVSRAVEKLRTWLAGRGVVVPAVGLVALLGNLPTVAAPAGLAGLIASAAAANTASEAATTLAVGAVRDWWLVQVRRLMPWAVAALVMVSAGIHWLSPRPDLGTPDSVATLLPVHVPPTNRSLPETSSHTAETPTRQQTSKILLNVRSTTDNRPLTAQIIAMYSRRRGDSIHLDWVTDRDGNAEIPITNPPEWLLTLWVSAPGHVPVTVGWRHHEFTDPVLTYQCLLEPGQLLAGVVQDEAGTPVANARIDFIEPGMMGSKRQNIAFHSRLSYLMSDAQGRFRSEQMPVLRGNQGNMRYVVTHPEFIREAVSLEGPASLTTNHVVILRRGLKVAGQVMDSDGLPLSQARVKELHHVGRSRLEAQTDEGGRFALGSFPPGKLQLEITAPGFMTAIEEVQSGSEALSFRLSVDQQAGSPQPEPPPADTVRLSGTVVDEDSGDPVPSFTVLRHSSGLGEHLLGDGHDGQFNWVVENHPHEPFFLEVTAEGFDPAVSDERTLSAEEHAFRFRLRRGGPANGRVVDASGQPVAGAVLGLNGLGFGFLVRENRMFSGTQAPQAITDTAGRFSLELRLNTESLVVTHEAGFAEIPVKQAKGATIVLQPWGAIEGVVLTAGRPTSGQQVSLKAWLPDSDSDRWPVELETRATTDQQGHFRFSHVPPGPVALRRLYKFSPGPVGIIGMGPQQRVDVMASGVTKVTLTTLGRSLVGRLELDRPVAGHQWRDDLQTLEEVCMDCPPLEVGEFSRMPDTVRQMRAYARQEARIRRFCPDIQPDGSFRLDDVPAGTYTLKLRVSVPPTDHDDKNQRSFRKELGRREVQVVVPAGDHTASSLDLGRITIPVKQP